MNERTMEFRVGVTILGSILFAAIILAWVAKGPIGLMQATYPIYIKFNTAPGVIRDTPIRKDGIRIGRVVDVRFADDDSGVIVTAQIDQNRTLYSDEQCKLTSSFPMSDASLDFVRNVNFQGERKKIEKEAILQGQMASDVTNSIASLQSLQQQAYQTLTALNTASRDMHDLLGDTELREDIKQTIKQVGKTFASLDSNDPNGKLSLLIDNLLQISKELNNPNGKLNQLGDGMLQFSKELKDPNGKLNRLTDDMLQVSKEMRDPNTNLNQLIVNLLQVCKNLNDSNNSLGALLHDNKELYGHVNGTATNLEELTFVLTQLSKALNDPKNSLGALLHDDKELYLHVSHIAKNFDELSRDLKPIANNVSVFTDKIARHPSTLGVKGALEKDSGLKDDPLKEGCPRDPPETPRWPLGGGGSWSIGH